MIILIGSQAIKNHFPDFSRKPKDLDYIITNSPEPNTKSTREIEYLHNPVFDGYPHKMLLPNDLYTLKISHLFWDINWDKHMFDVQFLKSKGCELDMVLFYKLYTNWNVEHGKNVRSDLNMSATDFFDNAVSCEYDHDDIHLLINPNPIYKKIHKDGEEVDVDSDKFELLSFEDKCDLVREEVYVMAWERFKHMPYKHAYSRMLKKFIMNHAPMWEALFIIENYIILHKPIINYYKKIEDGLQSIK